MNAARAWLIAIMAVGLVLMGAGRVSGEPFVDVYGGLADTESTRVTASHRSCAFLFGCFAETKDSRNIDFDTSATFGVRGGYWFLRWVGVAGDLSHFEAEQRDVRFRLVPLSLLAMVRLPLLPSESVPAGQLQPYVALGPSLFFHEASVDFRPPLARKVMDSSVDVGFDARVGLAWQFHRRLALFTEYRFTHLPISTEDDSSFGGVEERVKATLNTHHLLVGVSFRF